MQVKGRNEVSTQKARRSAPSPCSTACLTQDHKSWGECVRSKGLQLSPHVNDQYATRQKAWDKELDNYDSARRQGLEPRSTKQWAVDQALKEADSG